MVNNLTRYSSRVKVQVNACRVYGFCPLPPHLFPKELHRVQIDCCRA